MTEVLFYHLQNMSLEAVLPPMVEKSLERGWRVVVQASSEERADALDAHLWTYRDDSFLPHATWRAGDAEDQPVLIAVEDGNPNNANVRFLVDNAALPADCEAYERVVLIFNGDEDEARAAARAAWTDCRAASRSRTGRRMNGAGGNGGNSGIRQLMIIVSLLRAA
jgi:DNA polymerase-3 subunit chi